MWDLRLEVWRPTIFVLQITRYSSFLPFMNLHLLNPKSSHHAMPHFTTLFVCLAVSSRKKEREREREKPAGVLWSGFSASAGKRVLGSAFAAGVHQGSGCCWSLSCRELWHHVINLHCSSQNTRNRI